MEALARRGVETPFAIQELVIADGLNGQDLLAKSPTGSGKTLAFAIPIVQRIDPTGRRPSALVLVPTRELALQVADEFASIAPARGVKVAAVYGGTPVVAQGKRAKDAHVLVATPGRLRGPRRAPARPPRRDRDPRARRGRPHARHGLPAAGRRDREAPAAQAPDDVLLGDARRRGRRARARVHVQPEPLRRRASRAPRERRDRAPVRPRHAGEQGRDARRPAQGRSVGSRSSSRARSAGRTGSCRS